MKCSICNTTITFKHTHHIIPQASGGKNKTTIDICSGCHNDLHRLVEIILKQGSNKAIQIAKSHYTPLKADNILKFSHIAAKHTICYKKQDIDNSSFILQLNEREKQALRKIALDNNTSMQKWIYNTLIMILKHRGYLS